LLASLESFPSVASFVADEGNRAGWDEKKERELEPDAQLDIFLEEILGCSMRGAARRFSRRAEEQRECRRRRRIAGSAAVLTEGRKAGRVSAAAANRGRWRWRREDGGGQQIAGQTVEGGESRAAQCGAVWVNYEVG
jgi:hypothetical protein